MTFCVLSLPSRCKRPTLLLLIVLRGVLTTARSAGRHAGADERRGRAAGPVLHLRLSTLRRSLHAAQQHRRFSQPVMRGCQDDAACVGPQEQRGWGTLARRQIVSASCVVATTATPAQWKYIVSVAVSVGRLNISIPSEQLAARASRQLCLWGNVVLDNDGVTQALWPPMLRAASF